MKRTILLSLVFYIFIFSLKPLQAQAQLTIESISGLFNKIYHGNIVHLIYPTKLVCNPSDFTISSTNPNELRNTSFSNTFVVTSPTSGFSDIQTNKCYIVKHGLYYENEICPWTEKRGKILISNSLRAKKPEIKMVFEKDKKALKKK